MKQRLDVTVVERGLAETRAKAQALIMAGDVFVDGKRVDKAGAQVAAEAQIEVKAGLIYVSRGGLKLAHALDVFGLRARVPGKVALDIGASTGGFTDVLLQAGASRVYAVDVGTNQLAWKLRTDPRVVVMEQTNIRDLEALPTKDEGRTTEEITNYELRITDDNSDNNLKSAIRNPQSVLADLATADVSFIGLELVTPAALRLTTPDAFFVFLIKPQFEAGRERVGKGGVVRDPRIHRDVIIRLAESWRGMGLLLAGLARSPITGPAGNVEYLAYLEKADASLGERSVLGIPHSTIDREVFGHGE
jgi:23S rRNA (cytidine1920-2'-O)/16S rRNA (cytidine1409-2'-O)-methyltransferase